MVPNVLDRDHCRRLMDYWQAGQKLQNTVAASDRLSNKESSKTKIRSDVIIPEDTRESQELVDAVNERVAVSSGAACSSATPGPSYVLDAMGVPKDEAAASIRFGLGRSTTEAEVEVAAEAVTEAVQALRARSPLWRRRNQGKPVDW